MNKITLPSGEYAVNDILQGFDIIEKQSSNVAFVGTCMITNQMYVQFKSGSGFMYSEVDLDTLSFAPVAESIGKFVSAKIVNKFPSEKQKKLLIINISNESISPVEWDLGIGSGKVVTGTIDRDLLTKEPEF